MKKHSKHKKFSRTSNERGQLFKNLLRSLAENDGIRTSEAKATAIRPMAEKLVTIAKEATLTSFRRLVAETGSVSAAKKYLELGKLLKNRQGGYLRRIRLSSQKGDNTAVIYLEWVEKLARAEIVKPEKKPALVETAKTIEKPKTQKAKAAASKK
jgi:large subunit ribosomal protein L17